MPSKCKDFLEMISKSDHSWLIDYIAHKTVFDANKIESILDFAKECAEEKLAEMKEEELKVNTP